MKTKPQGVCPNCGSYDNISVCGDVSLTRVALESPEWDGTGGTNAIIYMHTGERRFKDALPPPGRFYCDNCNQYFDEPKFVK